MFKSIRIYIKIIINDIAHKRHKYISDKNFLIVIAMWVGVLSGLAAVVLKYAVHFIQHIGMTVNLFQYFRLEIVAAENSDDFEQGGDDSATFPNRTALHEMVNLLKKLFKAHEHPNPLIQWKLI